MKHGTFLGHSSFPASIHATILHCLGLDHTRLIYASNGRPERPTVNEGEVIRKLVGA